MEIPKPLPEHRWLTQLVGDWTYESLCPMEPGKPPVQATGKERIRALGDFWVVGEGTGTMPGGGEMIAILTIGFDPQRKRFVGSWVGSPMPAMFVYEGQLDAARRVLTLDTTGPSFMDPATTTRYQDIVELVDSNTRLLRSQSQMPDGSWQQFMTATYKRVR